MFNTNKVNKSHVISFKLCGESLVVMDNKSEDSRIPNEFCIRKLWHFLSILLIYAFIESPLSRPLSLYQFPNLTL